MIGEGGKSYASLNKNKGKEATSFEGTVAVESKDVKIHRPEFFYKGQPLLANKSALKSPGVAYSLLSHSLLPTDERDMKMMIENSMKNQAFHHLMKVNCIPFVKSSIFEISSFPFSISLII